MFFDFYVAEAAKNRPIEGLKAVVQALLLSPDFIYHPIFGDEKYGKHPNNAALVSLNPVSKCAKFSQVFFNARPSANCINAAENAINNNRNFTQEEWDAITKQLLTEVAIQNHLIDYLSVITGIQQTKAEQLAPDLRKDWRLALTQFREFLKTQVLQNQTPGGIRALFSSSTYPINDKTTHFFNQNITSTTDVLVTLNSRYYRGILGLPAYVAADYSDVFKGLNMLENFLGVHLPSPTVEIVNDRGEIPAKDRIVSDQCKACHLQSDPLGFQILRNFSSLGKVLTENQRNVKEQDAPEALKSGSIELEAGFKNFSNLNELSNILANEPAVWCQFAKQYFAYAEGRRAEAVDQSSWKMMCDDFINSGGNFKVLPYSYLRTPAFNYVKE